MYWNPSFSSIARCSVFMLSHHNQMHTLSTLLFNFHFNIIPSKLRCSKYSHSLSFSRSCRLRLKCDGTRAETRFSLSAKRTSLFNRRWRQFSRLLEAEVCASTVVMLDTPCSEVVWRVLATHSIRQFPLHFPLPCVTVCHHISPGLYCILEEQEYLSWPRAGSSVTGRSIPVPSVGRRVTLTFCCVTSFVMEIFWRIGEESRNSCLVRNSEKVYSSGIWVSFC
jgi:hypothetical protein